MKTNGYSINHATGTVTITKDFAKAMNDINSAAYEIIAKLRKDGYKIQKRTAIVKASKTTHKGLTIDFIERFVKSHRDRDMFIREFYAMKKLYKGQTDYYARLKEWFLNLFPELTAKARRERYIVLTMDFMDNFIKNHDYCDTLKPLYEKEKLTYKGHPAYYSKMKEWFIDQFPALTATEIKMEIDSEEASVKLVDELNKKEISKHTTGADTAANELPIAI